MDTFWKWFVSGSRSGPRGLWNVLNWFLFLHIVAAGAATYLIVADPVTFAQKALFPAASILIGLSMAWTTRASTILQSKELRDALFSDSRPPEDYIYGFQLAILVVMAMLVYVAIMAGGGLNISVFGQRWDELGSAFWMYLLMSLTLRECWGVINATNMLSMLEYLRTK
jgi:hypothetical protein